LSEVTQLAYALRARKRTLKLGLPTP